MNKQTFYIDNLVTKNLTSYNFSLNNNVTLNKLIVDGTTTFKNNIDLNNSNILLNGTSTIDFTSDKLLKTNIKSIENPLDLLKNINGVTFNWKNDNEKKRDWGVIAQDVEKDIPELINVYEDGYKKVQYIKLIPILIQCIKKQQEQIKELQKQMKKLQQNT